MPPLVRGILQKTCAAVQDNWLLLALALAHTLAAQALAYAYGLPYANSMVSAGMTTILRVIPAIAMVLLLWRLAYGIRVVRPARPTAWLLADLSGFLRDGRRLLSGAIALAAMMAFLSAFSLVKDMIPSVNAFHWDTRFAELDAALHGGVDPWRLLLPLTDNAYVMAALAKAYHFWIYVNLFLLAVACFSPADMAARRNFLLTYLIVWMLSGNLLAIYFSSGGPVYYQALGLGDRFADLTDRLHSLNAVTPIWALEMQARLWDSYTGASPGISGISAMPSMHVASTVVMALYAFSWRRWAGWLMAAYASVIMAGSVALGWHYAIDGYLGGAIALVVWAVVSQFGRARATNTVMVAAE